MRDSVVRSIINLARSLGTLPDGSEWYLFGSVDRDDPAAADIDLLILCISDQQADTLRHEVDPEYLPLPLDLSLMTFEEAKEIDAVRAQNAHLVFPDECTKRILA